MFWSEALVLTAGKYNSFFFVNPILKFVNHLYPTRVYTFTREPRHLPVSVFRFLKNLQYLIRTAINSWDKFSISLLKNQKLHAIWTCEIYNICIDFDIDQLMAINITFSGSRKTNAYGNHIQYRFSISISILLAIMSAWPTG